MKRRHHNAIWTKLIAVWALFVLFLLLQAPALDLSPRTESRLREAARPGAVLDNIAGQAKPLVPVTGSVVAAFFALYQPATSAAVALPTDVVTLPSDPVMASSPSVALLANVVVSVAPAVAWMPTATLGDEATTLKSTQPDSRSRKLGATMSNRTGKSARVTVVTIMATQEVATATAVVESSMTSLTTYTARVVVPSGSLLDRLTWNKPGVWGNKAFYVGLGIVYVVLLVLCLGLVFRLARQSD